METRQVSLNETLIFIHFYALIPLTPSMPRTLNFPNKRSLCGVFECYFTLTVPTPYLINVKHPEKRTLLSLSCVPAGALDSALAEPRKGGEKGEGGAGEEGDRRKGRGALGLATARAQRRWDTTRKRASWYKSHRQIPPHPQTHTHRKGFSFFFAHFSKERVALGMWILRRGSCDVKTTDKDCKKKPDRLAQGDLFLSQGI